MQEPTALVLGSLSTGSQAPLYQQIIDAIKREVAAGRLTPGNAMPSFRVLATQLAVSLITVKRAYEELEREGIIVRHQGLGTFVALRAAARSRSSGRAAAVEALREAVRTGREAGLADRDLLTMLKAELEVGSPQLVRKVAGRSR